MIHDFDPAIAMTPLGGIYWYGAVYTLGFLGVFAWLAFRRDAHGMSMRDVFVLSVLFAGGIMVGGRVFDILVYELDYYRGNPVAALNWWNGGMASHGVLLGGLIGTFIYSRSRGQSFLALLDEIVVPGVFLLAVGRFGNFIEGGVVGSETAMPWGVVYSDLEGARHPVALYESAKNFIILPILIVALRRWPPGRGVVTALFVLLYAGLRFAVDTFRDYEAAWLGLGTGQVFNLAMAAAGLALLLYFLAVPRGVPEPNPAPRRSVGWILPLVFAFLVIYPLGIPTSWTRENIAEKRQEVLQTAPEQG